MKEQIYTIPVIDAFKADTECPFCNLHQTLEKESIDFMLGASYMEDDIRMETNKSGFCPHHYQKLFNEKNRLGLALMLHSHFQEINNTLSKLIEPHKDSNSNHPSFLSGLIKYPKRESSSQNKNPISSELNDIQKNCYICNKIEKIFSRYMDTFFYLWKKDKEFISLVSDRKGFCLNHFSSLIEKASLALNKEQYNHFTQIIFPIQLENLKRIEEELDWFIQKFDYRFKDSPWNNSKDAVQRAILKVSSTKIEE
ncbi:MAG: hypothetical protein GX209_08865 [Epulopiscium sp.]|nr:hypothetical protein [Candidatus Epulonipiscium sp.]